MVSSRRVLVPLGFLQVLLGTWLVTFQVWRPVRDIYFFWDRVSEAVVSGALDTRKLDAQLITSGDRPSGLDPALVKASPTSRPGGFNVISDWMLPPRDGWLILAPSSILLLTGLLVVTIGFANPPTNMRTS